MTHSRERGAGLPLVEATACLAVIASLVWVVNRLLVDGALPQPFIYDANDTFMDWFNTAYWSHRHGAFAVWRTVYPPLSFVFLHFVGVPSCYVSDSFAARDCDVVGLTAIGLFYVGNVIAVFAALRKAVPQVAVFRTAAFAVGFPYLFLLERGNLILACFAWFVVAHGGLTRNPWLRSLGLAITINFKPYLLVPALGWVLRREWRLLELGGFATVAVYLLSLALLGEGTPVEMYKNLGNWIQFTTGLAYEFAYYSTSLVAFVALDTPNFPTRDFVDSRWFEPVVHAIPVLINVSRALFLACFAGAWLQPNVLTSARLAALAMLAYLVGSSPGGYAITFVVFLVFLEPSRRAGVVVAVIATYLSCINYDYVLGRFVSIPNSSWLGGQTVLNAFGLSVGTFARPVLVLVTFWALALDSMAQIVRAHRGTRPILDPRPQALFGRRLPG